MSNNRHVLYQDSVSQMTGDIDAVREKISKIVDDSKKQGFINIKFDIIIKDPSNYSCVMITGEKAAWKPSSELLTILDNLQSI